MNNLHNAALAALDAAQRIAKLERRRPPNYTILRRAYPDGRQDFRIRLGRFGWLRRLACITGNNGLPASRH
jgi:hypothetical protein